MDTPVRVLQFSASDETLRFMLPLMKALQADGFDVLAAAAKSQRGPDLAAANIPFLDVPATRQLRPIKIIQSAWALARLLKRERIDILQAHTYAGGMIGRLAGFLARTPIVAYTAHGWLYTPQTPPLKKNVIVATERVFKLFTDAFFVIGQEELDIGIRDKILRTDNSVLTLGVGVNCSLFDPALVTSEKRRELRLSLGIPVDSPVIVFTGRLVDEKGIFELGRAFAKLYREDPRRRLLMIGSADFTGRDSEGPNMLRRQLADAGCLDGVIFAGQRSDVRDLLGSSDIFALPTYREGMPVALLEAMSMALPAVTTNIPGCREEVIDGQCGFLIPPREDAPLEARLRELLNSPDLAQRLGQAARKRVTELFSLEKVLEIQVSAYRSFRKKLQGR